MLPSLPHPLLDDALSNGKKLKRWRLIRDYTQEKVGEILGLDARTIGTWENEQRPMADRHLLALIGYEVMRGHWHPSPVSGA